MMMSKLPKVVWCLAALLGFVFVAEVAPAESRRERKEKSQYVIRNQRVAGKLQKAQELIEAEKNAEARELLEGIRLQRIKPYPRALTHQALAILDSEEDDFVGAREHFEAALAENALPIQTQLAMRFNLGQLYMMEDQWPEAIETFQAWFADQERPTSVGYYMLALAYYQNEEPEKALEPATKAVELATTPKEPWLQLLLALHMGEDRYAEALPLIERLAVLYPKKVYWMQLAAVTMELDRDAESLAVQQLAYEQGYLTKDREIVRLGQMYLFHDLPWRAAKVLGAELESGRIESDYEAWNLYATALLAAREDADAVEPLRKAADLSENGEGYLQLSQVHIMNERWEEARTALRQAFAKGDLKSPGHANLLSGIVAYQQKRYGAAKAAFARAMRDEKTSNMAEQWMTHAEREQAAQAQLSGSTPAG